MSPRNPAGASVDTSTAPVSTDLGSLTLSPAELTAAAPSPSEAITSSAVLDEGALQANNELIDATREAQSRGHHHTIAQDIADEHRTLQRAGFEGSQGFVVSGPLQTTSATATTSTSQANEQLHEHILSLALSGTKKKTGAVTDDAELAEFVRQHPELSQYIKELQQARDQALKTAQDGKQSSLDSAASLNAKLDVIATLLEGSPIAPSLRMGDTVAKEAFISESKRKFENADEGAALAAYVWDRAADKLAAAEAKRLQDIAAGDKILSPFVDAKTVAAVADALAKTPATAPEAVRQLRTTLEAKGMDMHRALDPATPEGQAFANLIEKNSASPEIARQLKLMFFAAQLRADTYETSTKLPPEQTIDRFLALSLDDRRVVDSYFLAISKKTADRYLFEAYTGMRDYRREQGGTVLSREPTENREGIIAKIVLARARAEGFSVGFKEGRELDEGAFRKSVEKILDSKFGLSPSQSEIAKSMPGGLKALDALDYRMRVESAAAQLASVIEKPQGLSSEALAARRAEILANVLPAALTTDTHTKINLAPQFIQTLEALPVEERRALAVAYQTKTGMSLEQSARSFVSPEVAEQALVSLSVLLAADSAESTTLVQATGVAGKIDALGKALPSQDPEQLSFNARELYDALTAQGLSVNRVLDVSLDEGKAFDSQLRAQLKDENLVRQAKAALFAVELEREAAPTAYALPSQGMVGYFLGLGKEERATIERYFKGINEGSAEKYLIDAFSGARNYQRINGQSIDKRGDRPDQKQIITALIISAAEEQGKPLQLKDGQLADPALIESTLRSMFSENKNDPYYADYAFRTVTTVAPPQELQGLCRQALLIQTLQGLDNGASNKPVADIDAHNAEILTQNLKHMLAADPASGGNLAAPLVSFLGELSPERRAGLRDEYQRQTGRDLLTDIRAGMTGHLPAQADFVLGQAAMALGRDDYERSAGFITQSLAQSGKLTPQTFTDLLRGLDADGCLKGDPKSVDRLNRTIAAYEAMSGGDTFAQLLERNGIKPALVDAVRSGDRATIDAFNLRAALKGSGNPIQELHQLLGGEFNLNSRPELAAAYEKTFGEKFGDVRQTVVLEMAKAYREDVELRRKILDNLRSAASKDMEQLQEHDFSAADAAKTLIPIYGIYNAGTKFFYIWDGAYEAQAKDMARRAEENSKMTDVYVEKALRLKEVDKWNTEAAKLLEKAAELQAQGDQQGAAALDQQATVLFTKSQCRMLDVPFPTESLEGRTEAAQALAREHAELIKQNASTTEIEKKGQEAKAALDALIRGPWGPHQSKLVGESIKSVIEIDPSIDPRRDPKARIWSVKLMTNAEGTGYLDSIPESALALTDEENKQLADSTPGVRAFQEREIREQKRAQFEIEREFARNRMRPMGEKNLALLDLEFRYIHRKNMAEFQRDWDQVMANFDRTEGQLKAARTVVLVAGAMATGGAGLPYMLAITAGSHLVQGAGDVAVGNKGWKEAGHTFVYEGGKDLLNVAMAGGMSSLTNSARFGSFMKTLSGANKVPTSLLGRTVLTGRQLAVSGVSGSTFGVGMEATNLSWDVMLSGRDISYDEMRNRLTTAGALGFTGGLAGGGSSMLRGAVTNQGLLGSATRGLISTAEYSFAGASSQFQIGWGPNGSFGVQRQGFDAFTAISAVGSTYVGNRAAAHHAPGNNPNKLHSFALFQPEPGVYSTPGVRNFSVHAAELKPVTDRLASLVGRGNPHPIDTSPLSPQAVALSKEIAHIEQTLKHGALVSQPDAAPSAGLLPLLGGASEAPRLPGGSQAPHLLPSAEHGTPLLGTTAHGTSLATSGGSARVPLLETGASPTIHASAPGGAISEPPAPGNQSAGTKAKGSAPTGEQPGTASSSSDSNPGQRRSLTADERVGLEKRLAELKAEFADGLAKAKVDKKDGAYDRRAAAKIAGLDATESQALKEAKAEQFLIKENLKKTGTDAVSGPERQRLQERLAVLTEKTIPIETDVDKLSKKYRPDPKKPEEYAAMEKAIRDIAVINNRSKISNGLEGLTESQTNRLKAAYKVLDDVKYSRGVEAKLAKQEAKLASKAAKGDWAPEHLKAEKALAKSRAELKVLERTLPEGTAKDTRLGAARDQVAAAKRDVRIEREVAHEVRLNGQGTPDEFKAARDFVRAREEFLAAGPGKASPEVERRFTDTLAHHMSVQEAANKTAIINGDNGVIAKRLEKTTAKIKDSSEIEPLRVARKEAAEIDATLKMQRKEREVITKAREVAIKQLAQENANTPPIERFGNPKLAKLEETIKKLDNWLAADTGSTQRNEGPYHQRTPRSVDRDTLSAARELLGQRLTSLRDSEIPRLKEINSHSGRKYDNYPDVFKAAEKLALAERRYGVGSSDIGLEGRLSTVAEHPEVTRARDQLAEAKRIARADIRRDARAAQVDRDGEKYGWQSELIEAKKRLIDCNTVLERTKHLPESSELRELAKANRAAARAEVAIETNVFKRAIQNGYSGKWEIKLAREIAKLERTVAFDPVLGITADPRYLELNHDFNRIQTAAAQRQRSEAPARKLYQQYEAKKAQIMGSDELPKLRDLRLSLLRAETDLSCSPKYRQPNSPNKPNVIESNNQLRSRIEDLKQRLPILERVDQLARRDGYSTPQEIKAARTIAVIERKVGNQNLTMDELALRLKPKELADLQAAWSSYRGAQTEARRLAFNAKIDRVRAQSDAAIDQKPWIAERKLAAKEEVRLECELQKLKGSSPEVLAKRDQLTTELRQHRVGELKDAKRVDFLARTRGRGTEAEITAARKLVEAEKTLTTTTGSDSDSTAAQRARDNAMTELKVQRGLAATEYKLLSKAVKAEWSRDYSVHSIIAMTSATFAQAGWRTAASYQPGSALGEANTPLKERVETFEAICNRKLRPEEVEFLGFVPDHMYKTAVSKINAGWRPESPAPTQLTAGRPQLEGRSAGPLLEGRTSGTPALPEAVNNGPRALPAAPEVIVAADGTEIFDRRGAVSVANEAPGFSPREERELAELFARGLERDLARGTDSRGQPVDTARAKAALVAQKERISALLEKEIEQQRKMIEIGNEAARRGELPGGMKADPQAIKEVQRDMFLEIERLDRLAERVRAETDALREIRRPMADNSDSGGSFFDNEPESVFNFNSDDGEDGWWRNGGSAPDYRPSSPQRGGGGGGAAVRTAPAPVRERVSFTTNDPQPTIDILEPRNQGGMFEGSNEGGAIAAKPRAKRPTAPMTQREIDNFMLGVDDLDGSALDAALDRMSPTETPAPRPQAAPESRSPGQYARRPVQPIEPDPIFQPRRQPIAEPAPQSRVAVATESPVFDFNFEIPGTATDTAITVFSPEVETHMAALSAAIDESVPVTTTAIEPRHRTGTWAPELEPRTRPMPLAKPATTVEPTTIPQPAAKPVVSPESALAASAATGQLLGRMARPTEDLDLSPDQQPRFAPKPQPEPAPTRTRTPLEEETPTEKRRRRREEEGGRQMAEHQPDEKKREEKVEEERKKHVREMAKGEKRGGAKLRFTKIVDALGDDDLIVDDEEASGG